jgi:hypothetical protein
LEQRSDECAARTQSTGPIYLYQARPPIRRVARLARKGRLLEPAAWPRDNRNLIPYGILLKVSYCSVVFAYRFLGRLSFIGKPFAIIDVVFGVLFWLAYREPGSVA